VRGLNRVVISGYVQERITYGTTGADATACSFTVASSRNGQGKNIVAYVKINVYGEGFVRLCRARLRVGGYVMVEGELMNRDGVLGDLTEVRARELIFVSEYDPEGAHNGG
jgi:single-stranded DNA-binding protein